MAPVSWAVDEGGGGGGCGAVAVGGLKLPPNHLSRGQSGTEALSCVDRICLLSDLLDF